MGKPTGFLEYERENNARAVAPLERIKNFNEFHITSVAGRTAESGSTLYGLRRAVLPVRNDDRRHGLRLSAEQPGARSGMIWYIHGNWKQAYNRLCKDQLFSGVYFQSVPGTL